MTDHYCPRRLLRPGTYQARHYPPRARGPSPGDKADGLIERYNRALGRHEAQLSHELRAVEDEPEA
jgi:hypothetical protein